MDVGSAVTRLGESLRAEVASGRPGPLSAIAAGGTAGAAAVEEALGAAAVATLISGRLLVHGGPELRLAVRLWVAGGIVVVAPDATAAPRHGLPGARLGVPGRGGPAARAGGRAGRRPGHRVPGRALDPALSHGRGDRHRPAGRGGSSPDPGPQSRPRGPRDERAGGGRRWRAPDGGVRLGDREHAMGALPAELHQAGASLRRWGADGCRASEPLPAGRGGAATPRGHARGPGARRRDQPRRSPAAPDRRGPRGGGSHRRDDPDTAEPAPARHGPVHSRRPGGRHRRRARGGGVARPLAYGSPRGAMVVAADALRRRWAAAGKFPLP